MENRSTHLYAAPARRDRALAMFVGMCLIITLTIASAMTQTTTSAMAQVIPRETVQADVSTRTVGITSSFTGTEIIVFGAISNAQPIKSDQANYDVVVVVEGVGSTIVARRKSNLGGIWINTSALTFEAVPSYYAIASTRPLDEITEPLILDQHDIGFEHITLSPVKRDKAKLPSAEVDQFKAGIIRNKQKQRLYVDSEFGVAFVGSNLFRTTIDLPANVPVGPLKARVHLFREGILLDTFESEVQLAREGVGRYLYNFAIGYPLIYGIVAVFVAAGAGWAASTYFSRRRA
ncbi:MAG: TIGR02186 family protein [Hyphomicrobiaceae bacterium]